MRALAWAVQLNSRATDITQGSGGRGTLESSLQRADAFPAPQSSFPVDLKSGTIAISL